MWYKCHDTSRDIFLKSTNKSITRLTVWAPNSQGTPLRKLDSQKPTNTSCSYCFPVNLNIRQVYWWGYTSLSLSKYLEKCVNSSGLQLLVETLRGWDWSFLSDVLTFNYETISLHNQREALYISLHFIVHSFHTQLHYALQLHLFEMDCILLHLNCRRVWS